MLKKCQICKIEFQTPKKAKKFCSRECYGLSRRGKPSWNKGLPAPWAKNLLHAFKKGEKGYWAGKKRPDGERSANWKGGRRFTKQGYVLVMCKDNPNCDAHGYVFEHRLVMEKHIGRYLESYEIIHHRNGDKQDNRVRNLEITTRGQHIKHHKISRWPKQK